MKNQTLTSEQIAHFVEEGYLLVPQAFPRDVAEKVRILITKELPFDPEDRSTWKNKLHVVQHSLTGPDVDNMYTSQVYGAFDDLMGPGRYFRQNVTGYMLVNLPGFAQLPWTPPTVGWHIDGSHFHHHINSREQGLIALFLFSDVNHAGGATALKPRSHRITARILQAAEPEGLHCNELTTRVEAQTKHLPVVEITGNAGDMVIMHPHVYHSSSDNCSERMRVASNICLFLNEPMNLQRPDHDEISPVEKAIVESLSEAHA